MATCQVPNELYSFRKERTVQEIAFYELYFVSYPLNLNLGRFYFKTGDESGRGRILTSDGQATLFLAKSLLTALVKSISDASITVIILTLLYNYKDRFLQLLEADSSTHNIQAIRDTERNLNERIREIQEFQALKTKLSSFIHMCEVIPPGENKRYKLTDWPADEMWNYVGVHLTMYFCCYKLPQYLALNIVNTDYVLWSRSLARFVSWYLMLTCCQSAPLKFNGIAFCLCLSNGKKNVYNKHVCYRIYAGKWNFPAS